MKVKLRQEKVRRRDIAGFGLVLDDRWRWVHWIRGLPFTMSPNGVLVHRVKSAKSLIKDGEYSHDVAKYWCTGGGHSRKFFSEPPEGHLVCHFCEINAVAAGEPSSETLIGHHVHVGTMKVVRQCCKEQDERN